jgi:DNA repair protein RecO (recombination protein O)
MAAIADSSVVLRRLDYSETSQIIVFFTRRHGKVRAIGKGIKRGTKTRFAVGIDLLDIGDLVVSVRQERSETLATLTEWTQTRSLPGLREKLFRIHGAQYAAEITAQLTEDWDPHATLWEALVGVFVELSQADEPLGSVVPYQRRLLEAIGSLPRFDACVLCGRSSDLTHFSSFEGGMVCRHCEPAQVEKVAVSSKTQRALGGRDEAGSLAGSFGVMNYHIAHLMGREPLLADKLVTPKRRRMVE